MLSLYNTLSKTKEVFTPIKPGHIGLYVCGNTIYDHCHLGHARSMLAFDVIVRYLRANGWQVTYIRNITDIDDKIIVRALERGISIEALTSQYIKAMDEDAAALYILKPDQEPRATHCIEPIISLITRLIDKGHAYVSDNGDVCYQVDSFPDYGKLSHKDIEGLLSGARIEIVKEKRSPLDFVLWKKAKPQEPSWPSPWGLGRPGWHIECSAMAMQALGEHFDIHGGGSDLQFPHHENEIAQSEAASGKPFANYWLHVGMLQLNGEKMAKSTGNFLTIADALQEHHPEVIRYFLLSSHYRSPLNYSKDTLANAQRALTRLYQAMFAAPDFSKAPLDETWINQFKAAMDDDFNTPLALSVLFQLSHALNKDNSPSLAATLKHLANMLGLMQQDAPSFLQSGASTEKTEIDALLVERQTARQNRDFARADAIRDQLLAQGIEIEDLAEGSRWRKVLD